MAGTQGGEGGGESSKLAKQILGPAAGATLETLSQTGAKRTISYMEVGYKLPESCCFASGLEYPCKI